MLATLLLAVLSVSAATCDEPVSASEIRRVLDVAGTAWMVMDRTSFEAATAERREAVPCLADMVDPELAIQLHLHEALAWSIQRRSDLSQGAFRAILALQPGWELPLEMAPERHRLRADFEQVRAGGELGERRPFAPPGDGALMVDGLPSRDVPTDRPFVVQMLDRRGDVVRTHYFTPGSEAPQQDDGLAWWLYDGEQGGAGGLGAAPEHAAAGRLLLGGAAGAGLLAGGIYVLAASRANALDQGQVACEDLPGARSQVNQLVGASAGLGAVGLGLGVTGLVIAF